jgi:hypothetical protein
MARNCNGSSNWMQVSNLFEGTERTFEGNFRQPIEVAGVDIMEGEMPIAAPKKLRQQARRRQLQGHRPELQLNSRCFQRLMHGAMEGSK